MLNICHEPQSVRYPLACSMRVLLPVMRAGRDRGLALLLAPFTELFYANRHPVAMVIYSLSFHCAKYFYLTQKCFFLLCMSQY